MKNCRKVAWCVTALTATPIVALVLASCGDSGTDLTPTEIFNPGQTPVIVSEPVAVGSVSLSPAVSAAPGLVDALDARESMGFTYISYAPGSIPGADSIRVENLSRNRVIGARMVDGGLDPIAIPADVGDSLSIQVFSGGTLLADDDAIVPEEDPPKVVRTSPGRRQTRVPLNANMEVIFSEPISPSSVNSETILLLNGTRLVPTELSLGGDGLRVSLSPVEPLQPGITYTILITAELVDLSGSGIQAPFSAEFTTEYAAGTGAILVSTTTVNNLDPDGLVLSVDGVESATLDPNGSSTIAVPQGHRELMISGVAPNCVLEGQNPRPVTVSEGTTVTESFAVSCTDPPEGRILFHHGGDESTWISVMNVDGSGKIELRSIGSGEDAGRSEWSPDGSRIAFSDYNTQGGLEIFLMNKDGSGVAPLRPGGDADRWERAPSWSPSGEEILFESRNGIWLTDRLGLEVVEVWGGLDEPKMPEWSWDGENITWASQLSGHLMYKYLDRALTVIRDGDHVCGGGECVDDLPIWSPVWARVLFRRADGGSSFSDGLWVWDFQNKTEALLVEGAVWFDWSPDGSKIVYTDSEKIVVMNADGSGKTVIRDLSENYDQATETAYSRLSWGR